MGEGNSVRSTLSTVYSLSSLTNNGFAVSGYADNIRYLDVNDIYTWADGNPNHYVWGTMYTSLNGHQSFTFDQSGVAVVESNKLLDKLNSAMAQLGLNFNSWIDGTYTLPDSTSVTVPTFNLQPQLTDWRPWEAD